MQQEFCFSHEQFETPIRHSREDVDQDVGYASVETKRKSNLGISI